MLVAYYWNTINYYYILLDTPFWGLSHTIKASKVGARQSLGHLTLSSMGGTPRALMRAGEVCSQKTGAVVASPRAYHAHSMIFVRLGPAIRSNINIISTCIVISSNMCIIRIIKINYYY